jgi:membrane protein DedA with SNARE-associated domain
MNIFKMVVDVLIKLMIPFVILALILGMAKMCLDLKEIFNSPTIHWVALYGYPAIVLGTIAEGETILLMAGLASSWGYLSLPWVMVMAFIGSFSGDEMFFFLGRHKGWRLLSRHKKWQSRVDRIHQRLKRHHALIILGFRFCYGFRLVTPLILGMDPNIRTGKFMVLNGFSALAWSVLVSGGGYLLGEAVQVFLPEIRKLQLEILIGLFCLGALAWMVKRYRRRGKVV